MADETPTVASAIHNSEPYPAEASAPTSKSPEPESRSHQSLKRRQSDSSETDSKRRRLSTDDSVPPTGPSPPPLQDERRKRGQAEERKRGQRLFGGLLNTLSQGSTNATHKRRAEIEKKQFEKLRLQKEEDSQRQAERLERLQVVRSLEQKKYNEKTLRIRHANMLHQASHLQTETEPRLFYKPWDPLPEQEDQIRRQVEEAQDIIDQELRDFEHRRQNEMHDESEPAQSNGHSADAAKSDAVGAELTQEATDTQSHNIAESANTAEMTDVPEVIEEHGHESDAGAAQQSVEEQMKDSADENQGEMVVEADEDTVIY